MSRDSVSGQWSFIEGGGLDMLNKINENEKKQKEEKW